MSQNQVLPDPVPPADRPSLRDLLPHHLGDLAHYVRQLLNRTLRDHESASDLVLSVCGDLLAEGVPFDYRSEPQFQSWLRTVVLNKVRSRLRRLRTKKHGAGLVLTVDGATLDGAPGENGTPSQHAILHEDLSLLDRALARLPDDHREVIVQVHLLGRSHAVASALLGRTEEANRTLLTRAKVKLAGELDRLHGQRGKS